jgi:hypothetical protein
MIYVNTSLSNGIGPEANSHPCVPEQSFGPHAVALMTPDDKTFVWMLWVLIGLSVVLGLILLFTHH